MTALLGSVPTPFSPSLARLLPSQQQLAPDTVYTATYSPAAEQLALWPREALARGELVRADDELYEECELPGCKQWTRHMAYLQDVSLLVSLLFVCDTHDDAAVRAEIARCYGGPVEEP